MEELFLGYVLPNNRKCYLTTHGLYLPNFLSVENAYALAKWLSSEEVLAMLVCLQRGWKVPVSDESTHVSIPIVTEGQ